VQSSYPPRQDSPEENKLTLIKRTSLLLSLSLWLLASSAFGITSKPSEIAYVDAAGNQRIYSFAGGNNGHLVVNYWDGFSWHWADQGLPAGSPAVTNPSAITYVSGGNQMIYAFAQGSMGHLVVNYWDGFNWHWADQGLPAGVSEVTNPTAITYVSGGHQLIYVFAAANNGHLVVNYWDGFAWHWADQGIPAGTPGISNPSAITYLSGGSQRIYIFAAALSGHLVVNYWDGSAWHWADQGVSAGSTMVYDPSVITYTSGGLQRIYAFAQGSNGHLVVNYWDGSAWHWADQGVSAGSTIVSYPSAITYVSAGVQRIYAFAQASDGHLVVNYWNGSAWYWADQGLADGYLFSYPSAITYLSAGVQFIYVFGEASNNNLVVNYWNGYGWYWADQGTM
jgi:hypothetical protein